MMKRTLRTTTVTYKRYEAQSRTNPHLHPSKQLPINAYKKNHKGTNDENSE